MIKKRFLKQFAVELNPDNPAATDLFENKLISMGYRKFPNNVDTNLGKYICGNIHIGDPLYDIANGFFCYYFDVYKIRKSGLQIYKIEENFDDILNIAKEYSVIYKPFLIGCYSLSKDETFFRTNTSTLEIEELKFDPKLHVQDYVPVENEFNKNIYKDKKYYYSLTKPEADEFIIRIKK